MQAVRNGYIGFDPTADSLHVGNLVQIMMLVHFQRCGHKPDRPGGRRHGHGGRSQAARAPSATCSMRPRCATTSRAFRQQLERFIDFKGANAAELVNNYDWFKDMGFLRFIREVGKHITVNYMMAKDSVKNRLETTGSASRSSATSWCRATTTTGLEEQRLHAADGRQRPVGQHHHRYRAYPADGRGEAHGR